ncbi:MAG: outer membrane beta-barrel protein [Gemmatimonadetes bacterium]|nr:outer membrane beta-barrel protein [Gemmatimonadota bacterium]
MRSLIRSLFVAALLLGVATSARAQGGFALKGHYIFNSSSINDRKTDTIPDANGFSIGAEMVLPMGIGVGVSGYTSTGKTDNDAAETKAFTVLGEANYFLKLPLLPVAPYAGVHAGLGRYTKDDLRDPQRPSIKDSRTQLGYQLGVRVQLSSLLGLDAQYRRVSTSAAESQEGSLERNQYLVGVTLF